ncbi:MAG: tRNA (adenosine(37)-N6)-threonylcarbamoyltransferase complex dimerization subunit type 1 TsaB [Candidatus Margulisiibacteriota bacterium]
MSNSPSLYLTLNTAIAPYGLGVVRVEAGTLTLLQEHRFQADRLEHSDLLVHLESVLAAAGATLADVAKIGVTTGPGGYTGLRLGATVANMLALVQGIPVVGCDTLAALAQTLADDTLIFAVAPGRKNEICAAVFGSQNGKKTRQTPTFIWPIETALEKIAAIKTPVTVVGGFPAGVADRFLALSGPRVVTTAVSALALAELAQPEAGSGQVRPVYAYQAV